MLNANRVTITICGKEYTLQTDEAPSYVKQLAARLDRRIAEMMEGNDTLSLSSAAILVGLSLMDDSYKTSSNMDNIRGEIRNYVEELKQTPCAVSWRSASGKLKRFRPSLVSNSFGWG